jgi:Zn-dependent M28 family amino/carboxypeptidase
MRQSTGIHFAPSLILLTLLLWSCQISPKEPVPITTQEIESHIRFLSDDLLEGRAIGSRGLAQAALYQEDFFRSFGLEPFFGSSFRQSFPLTGVTPDRNASLEVFPRPSNVSFQLFEDFVIKSEREDNPEEISGDLVYCGYLIQANERNWDDIKNADLKGKVLLVEINEPGNSPGGIFDGEDMTYYGRWVYKFGKAGELGAAGVLLIHNTKGAAYGWEVVRNGWSRETFFLPDKNNRLFFQGWVQEAFAEKMLESVKLDHKTLLAQAETQNFQPVPLGLKVKVRQHPSFRTVNTENVAALLRGKHKDHRDQSIILSAHYDHLGKNENLEGDKIYNGAVDNCSATATMLALASYYAQRPQDLKVNLIFAGVTAEEENLLGSDYFARHLPVPASAVLADINFEMTNVWGETEDVYGIGARHSDLDDILRLAAANLGVRYIPERNGELGFFFRSDQLSFARAGIPAVWLHQGIVSKGEDKGLAFRQFEDYQQNKYHKVTDEMAPDWDLRGAVQVADWAREIIRLLQESGKIPQFKETSSFSRKAE